jgi:beta-glucosidase
MYKEDVAILKTLGHKVFRFSLEWARIEPSEGEFSAEAIEHYLDVMRELKANEIKVFLTLVHFTVPEWFSKKGGFLKEENFVYFLRFVERVVPIYAPYVDFWCIFNEINAGLTENAFRKKFNCTRLHAKAYHIIKGFSDKPISTAHAYLGYFPKRLCDPFDNAILQYADAFSNEFFFHAMRTGELVMAGIDGIYDKEIKGTVDFWSINSYDRKMRDARRPSMRGTRYSMTHTPLINEPYYQDEFYPELFIHALTRLRDKPIFISENGCAADNDDFRIVYLAEYLAAINEAMGMGVEVMGYLYWSLLDNYEWGSFKPRYGLVDVDRENGFKRTIKPSGYFLREIIESGKYTPALLRKYLKELPRVEYDPGEV